MLQFHLLVFGSLLVRLFALCFMSDMYICWWHLSSEIELYPYYLTNYMRLST